MSASVRCGSSIVSSSALSWGLGGGSGAGGFYESREPEGRATRDDYSRMLPLGVLHEIDKV